MHTKHRVTILQMETTLAVLGDHRRYPNQLNGKMKINPYEATSAHDREQNRVAWYSSYFKISSAIGRFSFLFVIGTVFGIVLIVAQEAGFSNAVRDLADPGGLRMLSITIPFACLASTAYKKTERSLTQMLIRLLAGVTMGASFCFLVWHADKSIGDYLGVNLHTNAVAVFVFPFSMYLIAICTSIFIEYVVRLAMCRNPTDSIHRSG